MPFLSEPEFSSGVAEPLDPYSVNTLPEPEADSVSAFSRIGRPGTGVELQSAMRREFQEQRGEVTAVPVFGKALDRETVAALDGGSDYLEILDRNKRRTRGFVEAISDFNAGDTPFVGDVLGTVIPIREMRNIASTIRRVNAGEPVSDQERLYAQLYLADMERKGQQGVGGMVGDIVRQMPGFMAEIGTYAALASLVPGGTPAGAVFGGGKFVAGKAVRSVIGRTIEKAAAESAESALKKSIVKLAGKEYLQGIAAKGTLAAAAGAELTAVDSAVNALANVSLGRDPLDSRQAEERLIQSAVTGGDLTEGKAKMMALADKYIEYASESSGGLIGHTLGVDSGKWAANAFEKLWPEKFLKEQSGKFAKTKLATILGMKTADGALTRGLTPKAMYSKLKSVGYDGFIEEMMEERVGGFARGLLGLEGDEPGFRNALDQMWPQLDQLKAEAIAFSVPMFAVTGATRGRMALAGQKQTEIQYLTTVIANGAQAVDENGTTRVEMVDNTEARDGRGRVLESPQAVADAYQRMAEIQAMRPDSVLGRIAFHALTVAESIVTGSLAGHPGHRPSDMTLAEYGLPAITGFYLKQKQQAKRSAIDSGKSEAEAEAEATKFANRSLMFQISLARETQIATPEFYSTLKLDPNKTSLAELTQRLNEEALKPDGLLGSTKIGDTRMFFVRGEKNPVLQESDKLDEMFAVTRKAAAGLPYVFNHIEAKSIPDGKMRIEYLHGREFDEDDLSDIQKNPLGYNSWQLSLTSKIDLAAPGGTDRMKKMIGRHQQNVRSGKLGTFLTDAKSNQILLRPAGAKKFQAVGLTDEARLAIKERAPDGLFDSIEAANEALPTYTLTSLAERSVHLVLPTRVVADNAKDLVALFPSYLDEAQAKRLTRRSDYEDFARDVLHASTHGGKWSVGVGALNTPTDVAVALDENMYHAWEDMTENALKLAYGQRLTRISLEEREAATPYAWSAAARRYIEAAREALAAMPDGKNKDAVLKLLNNENSVDTQVKLFAFLHAGFDRATGDRLPFMDELAAAREFLSRIDDTVAGEFVREIAAVSGLLDEGGEAVSAATLAKELDPQLSDADRKEIAQNLNRLLKAKPAKVDEAATAAAQQKEQARTGKTRREVDVNPVLTPGDLPPQNEGGKDNIPMGTPPPAPVQPEGGDTRGTQEDEEVQAEVLGTPAGEPPVSPAVASAPVPAVAEPAPPPASAAAPIPAMSANLAAQLAPVAAKRNLFRERAGIPPAPTASLKPLDPNDPIQRAEQIRSLRSAFVGDDDFVAAAGDFMRGASEEALQAAEDMVLGLVGVEPAVMQPGATGQEIVYSSATLAKLERIRSDPANQNLVSRLKSFVTQVNQSNAALNARKDSHRSMPDGVVPDAVPTDGDVVDPDEDVAAEPVDVDAEQLESLQAAEAFGNKASKGATVSALKALIDYKDIVDALHSLESGDYNTVMAKLYDLFHGTSGARIMALLRDSRSNPELFRQWYSSPAAEGEASIETNLKAILLFVNELKTQADDPGLPREIVRAMASAIRRKVRMPVETVTIKPDGSMEATVLNASSTTDYYKAKALARLDSLINDEKNLQINAMTKTFDELVARMVQLNPILKNARPGEGEMEKLLADEEFRNKYFDLLANFTGAEPELFHDAHRDPRGARLLGTIFRAPVNFLFRTGVRKLPVRGTASEVRQKKMDVLQAAMDRIWLSTESKDPSQRSNLEALLPFAAPSTTLVPTGRAPSHTQYAGWHDRSAGLDAAGRFLSDPTLFPKPVAVDGGGVINIAEVTFAGVRGRERFAEFVALNNTERQAVLDHYWTRGYWTPGVRGERDLPFAIKRPAISAQQALAAYTKMYNDPALSHLAREIMENPAVMAARIAEMEKLPKGSKDRIRAERLATAPYLKYALYRHELGRLDAFAGDIAAKNPGILNPVSTTLSEAERAALRPAAIQLLDTLDKRSGTGWGGGYSYDEIGAEMLAQNPARGHADINVLVIDNPMLAAQFDGSHLFDADTLGAAVPAVMGERVAGGKVAYSIKPYASYIDDQGVYHLLKFFGSAIQSHKNGQRGPLPGEWPSDVLANLYAVMKGAGADMIVFTTSEKTPGETAYALGLTPDDRAELFDPKTGGLARGQTLDQAVEAAKASVRRVKADRFYVPTVLHGGIKFTNSKHDTRQKETIMVSLDQSGLRGAQWEPVAEKIHSELPAGDYKAMEARLALAMARDAKTAAIAAAITAGGATMGAPGSVLSMRDKLIRAIAKPYWRPLATLNTTAIDPAPGDPLVVTSSELGVLSGGRINPGTYSNADGVKIRAPKAQQLPDGTFVGFESKDAAWEFVARDFANVFQAANKNVDPTVLANPQLLGEYLAKVDASRDSDERLPEVLIPYADAFQIELSPDGREAQPGEFAWALKDGKPWIPPGAPLIRLDANGEPMRDTFLEKDMFRKVDAMGGYIIAGVDYFATRTPSSGPEAIRGMRWTGNDFEGNANFSSVPHEDMVWAGEDADGDAHKLSLAPSMRYDYTAAGASARMHRMDLNLYRTNEMVNRLSRRSIEIFNDITKKIGKELKARTASSIPTSINSEERDVYNREIGLLSEDAIPVAAKPSSATNKAVMMGMYTEFEELVIEVPYAGPERTGEPSARIGISRAEAEAVFTSTDAFEREHMAKAVHLMMINAATDDPKNRFLGPMKLSKWRLPLVALSVYLSTSARRRTGPFNAEAEAAEYANVIESTIRMFAGSEFLDAVEKNLDTGDARLQPRGEDAPSLYRNPRQEMLKLAPAYMSDAEKAALDAANTANGKPLRKQELESWIIDNTRVGKMVRLYDLSQGVRRLGEVTDLDVGEVPTAVSQLNNAIQSAKDLELATLEGGAYGDESEAGYRLAFLPASTPGTYHPITAYRLADSLKQAMPLVFFSATPTGEAVLGSMPRATSADSEKLERALQFATEIEVARSLVEGLAEPGGTLDPNFSPERFSELRAQYPSNPFFKMLGMQGYGAGARHIIQIAANYTTSAGVPMRDDIREAAQKGFDALPKKLQLELWLHAGFHYGTGEGFREGSFRALLGHPPTSEFRKQYTAAVLRAREAGLFQKDGDVRSRIISSTSIGMASGEFVHVRRSALAAGLKDVGVAFDFEGTDTTNQALTSGSAIRAKFELPEPSVLPYRRPAVLFQSGEAPFDWGNLGAINTQLSEQGFPTLDAAQVNAIQKAAPALTNRQFVQNLAPGQRGMVQSILDGLAQAPAEPVAPAAPKAMPLPAPAPAVVAPAVSGTFPSGAPAIRFAASSTAGYPARTFANAAMADVTIDFAMSATGSGGVRGLTRIAAEKAGKTYVNVPVAPSGFDPAVAAKRITDAIKRASLKNLAVTGPFSVNMAGHELGKMRIPQAEIDRLVESTMRKVQFELSASQGNTIKSIRSGGQTGFDESGIKAGVALGLPTEVLAPKNWNYRPTQQDVLDDEAGFKARFPVPGSTPAPATAVSPTPTVGSYNLILASETTIPDAQLRDAVNAAMQANFAHYTATGGATASAAVKMKRQYPALFTDSATKRIVAPMPGVKKDVAPNIWVMRQQPGGTNFETNPVSMSPLGLTPIGGTPAATVPTVSPSGGAATASLGVASVDPEGKISLQFSWHKAFLDIPDRIRKQQSLAQQLQRIQAPKDEAAGFLAWAADKAGTAPELLAQYETEVLPKLEIVAQQKYSSMAVDPEDLNYRYEALSVNKGQGEYREYFIKAPFPVPGQHGEFQDPNLAGWFRAREYRRTVSETPVLTDEGSYVFPMSGATGTPRSAETSEGVAAPELTSQGFVNTLAGARQQNAKLGVLEIQEIQSELFQKNKGGFTDVAEPTNPHAPDTDDFYAWEEQRADSPSTGAFVEYHGEAVFLNLMLKDQTWVPVFVNAIAQWAKNQGFERVRFPTGETAARVEGHQVLADRLTKLQEERAQAVADVAAFPEVVPPATFADYDKVESTAGFAVFDIAGGQGLERRYYKIEGQWYSQLENLGPGGRVAVTPASAEVAWARRITGDPAQEDKNSAESRLARIDADISELKTQGIEKLAPIEAFYEKRISSIVNRMGAVPVTDANGNTWREVATASLGATPAQELPEPLRPFVDKAGIPDWKAILGEAAKEATDDTKIFINDVLLSPGVQRLVSANMGLRILPSIPNEKTGAAQSGIWGTYYRRMHLEDPKFAGIPEEFKQFNEFVALRAVPGRTRATLATAVHEYAHAATSAVLDNNKAVDAEIERLRLVAVDAFAQQPYGTTNTHEFIAEIFSNVTFRDQLAQIPDPSPKIGGAKTLWDSVLAIFSQAFRSLLSGGKQVPNSVLQSALTQIFDIMNSAALVAESEEQPMGEPLPSREEVPHAEFAYTQEAYENIPATDYYTIFGGERDKSTVTAATLQQLGIPIVESPDATTSLRPAADLTTTPASNAEAAAKDQAANEYSRAVLGLSKDEPILYHGTEYAFREFDPKYAGQNGVNFFSPASASGAEANGLTPSYSEALDYALGNRWEDREPTEGDRPTQGPRVMVVVRGKILGEIVDGTLTPFEATPSLGKTLATAAAAGAMLAGDVRRETAAPPRTLSQNVTVSQNVTADPLNPANLLSHIREHEGFRARAYRPLPDATLVIGYGHDLETGDNSRFEELTGVSPADAKAGKAIDKAAAERLLRADVLEAMQKAERTFGEAWDGFTPMLQRTLTDLTFWGLYPVKFPKSLEAAKAGNWRQAADELIESKLYREQEPKRGPTFERLQKAVSTFKAQGYIPTASLAAPMHATTQTAKQMVNKWAFQRASAIAFDNDFARGKKHKEVLAAWGTKFEPFKAAKTYESARDALTAVFHPRPPSFTVPYMEESLRMWAALHLPWEGNARLQDHAALAQEVPPTGEYAGATQTEFDFAPPPNPGTDNPAYRAGELTASLYSGEAFFQKMLDPLLRYGRPQIYQILMKETGVMAELMKSDSDFYRRMIETWALHEIVNKFEVSKAIDPATGKPRRYVGLLAEFKGALPGADRLTPEEHQLALLVQYTSKAMLEYVYMEDSPIPSFTGALKRAAAILNVGINQDEALRKVVPARIYEKLLAAKAEAEAVAGADQNKLAEELLKRRVGVYHKREDGTKGDVLWTVPADWVEAELEQSTYKARLVERGRDADELTVAALTKLVHGRFQWMEKELNKRAGWFLSFDGPYLRHRRNYAPHSMGRGMGFLGREEKAVIQALEKDIDKVAAEKEAVYRKVMAHAFQTEKVFGKTERVPRPLREVSDSMLRYLFDLKGLAFTSRDAALKLIESGERAADGLHKDMNYADVVAEIQASLDQKLMARKRGRTDLNAPIQSIEDPLALAKAVRSAMAKFHNREFSPYVERRSNLHDNYINAYINGGQRPRGDGAVEALHRYTASMVTAFANKMILNQMAMMTDATGAPMAIPDPNLDFGDDREVISDEVWRVIADRMYKYLGRTPDAKLTAKQQVASAVEAHFVKNKLYTFVQSPYPSIRGFYAFKAPGAQENILDSVLAGGEVAGYLKHIFNDPWKDPYGVLDTLDHVNSWMKIMALQLSLFFPMAGLEGVVAVGGVKGIKAIAKGELFDLRRAVKAGDPEIMSVIGRFQEIGITFSESTYVLDMPIGTVQADIAKLVNWTEKNLGAAAGQWVKTIMSLPDAQTRVMFDGFFNTVKLWTAMQIEAMAKAQALKEGRDFNFVRDVAPYARYIDEEVGGINANRFAWMTPTVRRSLNLLLFSMQWTMSAWGAAGGGLLTAGVLKNYTTPEAANFIAFRRWPQMAFYVMMLWPAMVQAAAFLFGAAMGGPPPDDDDKRKKSADGSDPNADHLFMWNNEAGREWHADVTPLLRNAPWYKGDPTGKRRVYVRWGKQANEVIRWLDDPWQSFIGKLSQIGRWSVEMATGEVAGVSDWNMPFKDMGLAGWIVDRDGEFGGSRLSYTVQKFLPFSVLGWAQSSDARPLSFVASTSKGMSFHGATEAMQGLLETWARNDTYEGVYKSPRVKANLEALGPEILDAAARNGYDAEKVLDSARGAVLKDLYGKLYRSLNDNDLRAVEKWARQIARVNGTVQGVRASVKNRNNMYGKPAEYTREQMELVRQAFEKP